MSLIVTWERLFRDPDTLPRGKSIGLIYAGQASDRPRLLDYLKYNPRFGGYNIGHVGIDYEGLILSALYIADTLDETEAKARTDGWGENGLHL